MSKVMIKIINLKTQNRKMSAINKVIYDQLNHRHGFYSTHRCPTEFEAQSLLISNINQMRKNSIRILNLRLLNLL